MTAKIEMADLLDGVITLPSLPTTVVKLMDLIESPECDIQAVSTLISADPSISIKTLRIVNSAYSGLRQSVASVDHAVAMLGLKVIKNLVVTATVFDTLKSEMADYMRHSIACGFAMRHIVEGKVSSATIGAPEDAFLYGLLHDVGKTIFEQCLPDEFTEVSAKAKGEGLPWYQAERAVLGPDHAAMGAELIKRWELPVELANAVAGHHDLGQCSEADTKGGAALIALSDHLAHTSGYPSHPDAVVSMPPEVWTVLGLEESDAEGIQASFQELLPAVEELVTVAGG